VFGEAPPQERSDIAQPGVAQGIAGRLLAAEQLLPGPLRDDQHGITLILHPALHMLEEAMKPW
jgi:hypothetical protein